MLNGLKSKLSSQKKGGGKDDELAENSDQTDTSFKRGGHPNSDSTQAHDFEDEESTEKKKPSILLITLCLVIMGGVLFWDEIFPPEIEVVPVLKPRPKPQPKVKPAPPPVVEETPKQVNETKDEVVNNDESQDLNSSIGESDPPLEQQPGASMPDSEPKVDVDLKDDLNEALNNSQGTGVTDTSDTIDGEVPSDESITDKILEDLEKQVNKKPVIKDPKKEYVTPPDYEYKGRGLVYNCVGKHWACVDAPSYKICEDNSTSVKFLGKKTECYPFNVYSSQKGCESMQNRMVSSSAKTKFCEEN